MGAIINNTTIPPRIKLSDRLFCWSIAIVLLFNIHIHMHTHTHTHTQTHTRVNAFTQSPFHTPPGKSLRLSTSKSTGSGNISSSSSSSSSISHSRTIPTKYGISNRNRNPPPSSSSFSSVSPLNANSSYSSYSSSSSRNMNIKFRAGMPNDESTIQSIMLRNLMNPLFIQHHRFIVAMNPLDDSDLYGFVQLRPIPIDGSSSSKSSSSKSSSSKSSKSSSSKSKQEEEQELQQLLLLRDPKVYDSKPGSISKKELLREELYDDIWDEFEEEELEFPNGFGSLPWSKQYRDYMEASKERRERNVYRMKMIEQKEQKQKAKERKGGNENENENENASSSSSLWELASVYVRPEWRKRGIGTELVKKVIAKHLMLDRNVEDIYLLTLDSTVGWYESFGFRVVTDTDGNSNGTSTENDNDAENEIPKSMKLEMAAGGIITKLMGNKLVCMRMRGQTTNEWLME